MIVKQLIGHISEETAFVVNDYPYGGLRCKIRFWLEHDKKKGYRFCSQTTNPKTGNVVWNKPKKSTYVPIAATMYLDEKNHVQWAGLGHYASQKDVLSFAERFPGACQDKLKLFVLVHIAYSKKKANGQAKMMINGVVQEPSEADLARYANEALEWQECLDKLTPISSFSNKLGL